MSSREPGHWALFAGTIVLAVLLFVGLVMIELLVDIASRKAATQLVTALVFGLAILKIRSLVRIRLERQQASALDDVTEHRAAPSLDRTRFHQLRDDVRLAARSQRHFDLVVWPRLVRLAKAPHDAPLAKPPGRSFGRGPSVEALTDLIAALEARR